MKKLYKQKILVVVSPYGKFNELSARLRKYLHCESEIYLLYVVKRFNSINSYIAHGLNSNQLVAELKVNLRAEQELGISRLRKLQQRLKLSEQNCYIMTGCAQKIISKLKKRLDIDVVLKEDSLLEKLKMIIANLFPNYVEIMAIVL